MKKNNSYLMEIINKLNNNFFKKKNKKKII